eukprot:1159184-Pelagomonas_calceolata.AAC.5
MDRSSKSRCLAFRLPHSAACQLSHKEIIKLLEGAGWQCPRTKLLTQVARGGKQRYEGSRNTIYINAWGINTQGLGKVTPIYQAEKAKR